MFKAEETLYAKNLVCTGGGNLGTFKDIDFEESGGRRGMGLES